LEIEDETQGKKQLFSHCDASPTHKIFFLGAVSLE